MTVITRARVFASLVTFSLAVAACAPKDADIKVAADQAVASVPGVTVDVANGVATISGEFADETAKASTEALVKAVKGVKSVVNNGTITPPPPPVVISEDDTLRLKVAEALKDFPTLVADVKDGVVTLTGEITRTDLSKVMQALSALHPKKIDNKATVKK
jgi:osmotically-inducible protein OsmY